MKEIKCIVVISLIILLFGCGGGEKKELVRIEDSYVVDLEKKEQVEISEIDAELMAKGKEFYLQCVACHQFNGEGLKGAFPPLANSDYMLADIDRTIKTILYGTSEPITVNGREYPGSTMTKFDSFSDEDIAAVTTYVLNSWNNKGGLVTVEMVASNR